MKTIDKFNALEHMGEWMKCEDREIARCFQRLPIDDTPDFEKQYERLYGINFGKIDSKLLAFIENYNKDDNHKSLAMSLAVSDQAFTVYLEARSGDDYQYFESSETDNGRTYLSNEAKKWHQDDPLRKRYGILPVVRNHLCVNWFAQKPSNIHELFLALKFTPSSSKQVNISEITDPFYRVAVRARKYPIVDYNLDALKKVVASGSNIAVTFGMNPADYYYNDDLFTVILEVDNSNVEKDLIYEDGDEGTTFLDFVHACPPFCRPPDQETTLMNDY